MMKFRGTSLYKSWPFLPFLPLFYFAFHLLKLDFPIFVSVEINTNLELVTIFKSFYLVNYDQALEYFTGILDSFHSLLGAFRAEFIPT